MRHRRSLLVVAGAAALASAIPVHSRLSATGVGQATPARSPQDVRAVPEGSRGGASPGQKGATYFAFESQAIKQTARFADATVVTERGFDGDLKTTVSDTFGNEAATLHVDRVDGVNDVVRYTPRAGNTLRAYGEASVRPTLDWSSHQAYSFWKDQADETHRLEWRGNMIRRKGGVVRDVEKAAIEMETDWATGISAKTVRKSVTRHTALPGRVVSGDVLVTRLMRNGTQIGIANWYPDSQILMWNVPGLTKGYIGPQHMKQFGGWPFVPDMAWLNLQINAFQYYKTEIQKKGFVASRQPGWSDRLIQFIAPTLQADEPGCDGLHWLDGNILRYCCDMHDFCYEKFGCNSRSWWRWWQSWNCSYCNIGVVSCFFTGGTSYPDEGYRQ